MVSIPACVCGLLAAAAASYHRGLDLDKDPKFQAKLKDPEQRNYIYGGNATTLDKEIPQSAKNAVFIFLGALAVIVFFAIFQNLLPAYDTMRAVKGAEPMVVNEALTLSADQLVKAKISVEGMTETFQKPLAMNLVIQIVMISAAALMIIFCKATPKKAVSGPVWQSGMVAVVAIYGIAWMADTYFSNYMPEIQAMLEGICAHQLSGRRCCVNAAIGLLTGYSWSCASGCVAFSLWLLLYPQLSFGYRYRKLRPFRYDGDW